MITGNKGEWSEIYALFKLLGDKVLYPGDSDMKKIKNLVYPILKILRTETTGNFEYAIADDIVIISSSEEELFRISVDEFKQKAQILLAEIKKNNSTFSVEEIEEFMTSINCLSLKAKSSAKTDITIVVHDQRTGQQPTLGFSIKSQLGGASTLLNAGKTTNFIYEIEDVQLTDEQIIEINDINTKNKIKDRIEKIVQLGGVFCFTNLENSVFENNLVLIDSCLPEIISECLYLFYTSTSSKSSDLVEQIAESNPLEYNTDNTHPYYSYKYKRFLTDTALGMMPSKVWKGELDATGGYLIVKQDGEILCYHIYNRNEFEDYLFNNTKFETASSSRHEFGKVYRENGKLYFKLNLQIRFL